ncbi:hypothetical protein [Mucilaginibacter flavidus]|uniref:hypothetical protein n=1 Tax=Mucilaginibacter flavidus TaxID=2949309 RepID=UPI00209210E7|nr:hypothetical protein [Mucilaginibacter flavidus]MCO5948666.1 hypothetical protein [Mucilaginibacter flavidus]
MISGIAAHGYCQGKRSASLANRRGIETTLIRFLKWHKKEDQASNAASESKTLLSITKGGYPDSATQLRIDTAGVAAYQNFLRKSGYFSETLLAYVRDYYLAIDKNLEKGSKMNALVKVNGEDIDVLLQTYDTADILDHIDKAHLDRCYIVYNKAIARLTISSVVKMIFTLTKTKNKWLIDYIGFDNTSKFSLGRE